MEWFKDLYDEFRMERTFGSVSEERTKQDVDFMTDVLNLPIGGKILDLFCGLGRHSIELARRGYNPIGIEHNQEYLNIARAKAEKNNVHIKFIQGDVRITEFGTNFDAAIIMYHSFGYFNDEEDRIILRKIHCALKQKGRFLIEILNRNWLLNNFKEHEESIFDDVKIMEDRKFDLSTNRVNFVIKRHKGREVIIKKGAWRFYSADEMTKILEDIGFKFIAGYNDLEKHVLKEDTRLMRLVYDK
jgi:SAM-dependent methyltransferase